MAAEAGERPPAALTARREMAWWGWGDPARERALPDGALAFLRETLAIDGRRRPPVALAAVRLPEPALTARARGALVAAVDEPSVRQDRLARVLHAAGKSYPDLVRQRSGDLMRAPDAVVLPGSHAEVRAVLDACAAHDVAVVPFGGGTSVVGGVEPLRDGLAAVVALDLGRLDRLLSVDERSLTAVLEPGLRGPEAEALLAGHGLTLGHLPQSHEHASIGGYVATRSAGQASTGYGRIDDLVLGLRVAAPAGDLNLPPVPASAAGPQLRELLVGSEGTFGVITEVALQVRPRPAMRRYDGWAFEDFAAGCEALRALEQRRAAPDVARLSDEDETRLSLRVSGAAGWKRAVLDGYLRLRGHAGGCLAILGWEGSADTVARRRDRGGAIARSLGGLALGGGPGAAWERGRFAAPYLRDELLSHGVMVETLETATRWSDLESLHAAVAAALRSSLRARGTPPLIGCHVSHLYPSGASLYFTWLARQEEGAALEQWRAAKVAATDAILAGGGTLTHHHAVGADHAAWLRSEVGDLGVEALRAVKARLDPRGIMNPGKLLPEDA